MIVDQLYIKVMEVSAYNIDDSTNYITVAPDTY